MITKMFNTKSYSLNEWNLNNRMRYQTSINLQESADNLLAKSEHLRDVAVEVTLANKEETDHHLEKKIKDIEFRKQELLKNRKDTTEELDALIAYKERLSDGLTSVKKNALDICEKCLLHRKNRIGIDLVNDEVNKELQKESKVIKGVQSLLERTLEETNEQIRKLKSALYFLDRDIFDKDENLQKNRYNLNLRERTLSLDSSIPLVCEQSTATLKEWYFQTDKNIEETWKELKKARSIRNQIDLILRQTTNDLMSQKNATDNAFHRRIEETKVQKSKLESQHAEIMQKAKEMCQNSVDIEKALADKKKYIALAQTRLSNRCQRSDLENTRDPVHLNLTKELHDLQNLVMTKLNLHHVEAMKSLRLLLTAQLDLEEEINIKINTLKIDEVDCMTLRQSIDYHAY